MGYGLFRFFQAVFIDSISRVRRTARELFFSEVLISHSPDAISRLIGILFFTGGGDLTPRGASPYQ